MTTTKQLTTKIAELHTKVAELEKQSFIDPLKATAEQITQNAQEEQLARENATHLKTVIEQLEVQLKEQQAQESLLKLKADSEENFADLVKQSDRVAEAVGALNAEMATLRLMAGAIASSHKKATGKLALDDRVSKSFILPKIENFGQSLLLHTEVRNYKS